MRIRSTLAFTALVTLTACGSPPATTPGSTSAAAPANAQAAPAPKPTPPQGWESGWADATTDKAVAAGTRSNAELSASLRPADEARKHGFFSFAVDVRDPDGAAITKPLTALAVSLDGKAVPGQWLARPLSDTGEAISVVVVLQATRSYTVGADDVPAPIQTIKDGTLAFLKALPAQAKASVMLFDNEGSRLLTPEAPVADAVKALEAWSPESKEASMAPPLYKSLTKAISVATESASSHRYVLLVTDGKDRGNDDARGLAREIDEVATAATSGHVQLLLFGCTLDMPEPLVNVNMLASKSNGSYRKIGDGTSCPAADLERAADHIKGRRVVGFRPTRDLGPDLQGVLQIDAEIGGAWTRRTLEGATLPLGTLPTPPPTK
ncbi:MAG: hypothetical protein JNJ59_23050 [Deltaproteobacteria bacterium]|nr:hypothetical protein [Deltaproteobacteria bacterium]